MRLTKDKAIKIALTVLLNVGTLALITWLISVSRSL